MKQSWELFGDLSSSVKNITLIESKNKFSIMSSHLYWLFGSLRIISKMIHYDCKVFFVQKARSHTNFCQFRANRVVSCRLWISLGKFIMLRTAAQTLNGSLQKPGVEKKRLTQSQNSNTFEIKHLVDQVNQHNCFAINITEREMHHSSHLDSKLYMRTKTTRHKSWTHEA